MVGKIEGSQLRPFEAGNPISSSEAISYGDLLHSCNHIRGVGLEPCKEIPRP